MRKNDFDGIAANYDLLSRIVFGRTLIKAQTSNVDLIHPTDEVLILGGGTGEILKIILSRSHKANITFVDSSSKMIAIAKRKLNEMNLGLVEFANCRFEDLEPDKKFDAILAPFFFDVFSKINLEQAILKVRNMLKPQGILLVTDFQKVKKPFVPGLWHDVLLWAMHTFFGLVANLESKHICEIHDSIVGSNFELYHDKTFYNELIFSAAYRITGSKTNI